MAITHLRHSEHGPAALPTLFDEVGGMETFDTLVRHFYEGVRTDELIWPMYPQDDLEGAIWRLSHFLAQYFGGPAEYSAQRGHPRLRMRHAPYAITPAAAERWLVHMRHALEITELSPLHRAQMLDYCERAAHMLINCTPEPATSTP